MTKPTEEYMPVAGDSSTDSDSGGFYSVAAGIKATPKTPREAIYIAREQFKPVDSKLLEQYLDKIVNQNIQKTAVTKQTKHYQIIVKDLQSLVDRRNQHVRSGSGFHPVSDNIIDLYMGCICRYVNKYRLANNGSPKCVTLPGSYTEGGIIKKSKYPNPSLFMKAIQDAGCPPEEIANLDYIFIPYQPSTGHWALTGFAPKQKFAFNIDSIPPPIGEMSTAAFNFVKNMIRGIPGLADVDEFIQLNPKDNKPESRIWATQRDWCNCGIFTVTNAMCLAFGYKLNCYRQDDMENKRFRMAAELISGGFKGVYKYKLINIPTQFQQPEPLGWDALRREHTDPTGAPSLLTPPDLLTPPKSGRKDKTRRRMPLSSKSHYTPTPAVSPTPKLWPAQFYPEDFEMIKIPKQDKVHFADLETKTELIAACRENKMKGHSKWAKETKEILRNWMENYAEEQKRNDGDEVGILSDTGNIEPVVEGKGKRVLLHRRPSGLESVGYKRRKIDPRD